MTTIGSTIAVEKAQLMEEDRFFATEWKKMMALKALVVKVMVPAVSPIFTNAVEDILTEREEKKADRRNRVAERLAKEEAARQARKLDNKNGVGPKGTQGSKTDQVTNPNSKKAQKQARKAKASKKV